MNPLFRLPVLLCCLCAFFVLSQAEGRAQPLRNAIAQDAKSITLSLEGFSFPRRISGMTHGAVTRYPDAALGFSVRYRADKDSWADIYIYDRQKDLSSGSPMPFVVEELRIALEEVQTMVGLGLYQDAKVIEQSSNGSFVKAQVQILLNAKKWDSFVFMTITKGKFVKIRLTTNAGPRSAAIASSFLSDFRRTLVKV